MIEKLRTLLKDSQGALILGYGREGQSTYRLLRKKFPHLALGIADKNEAIAEYEELQGDSNIKFFLGKTYLEAILDYDVVIKSPGITLKGVKLKAGSKIVSQTDIFLSQFSTQTIGITGTKGKSTTASLIYHFLKNAGKDTVLLGNIGIPPFDKIDKISRETIVVFEMSGHQLEYLHHSPHIAVLLNLFPEHLDHFSSLDNYYYAKMNVCRFQSHGDFFICEESVKAYLPKVESEILFFGKAKGLSASLFNQTVYFSENAIKLKMNFEEIPLLGKHNLKNLMAAMLAVKIVGVDFEDSIRYLNTFKTLPHRLEYVGNFGGIDFFNDSISTVPESAIAALQSIPNIDTIILGGFDRGLDYAEFIRFITKSSLSNLIFTGKAGEKMMRLLPSGIEKQKAIYKVVDMDEAFQIIRKISKKGSRCLLSPAAASYDQYHNFEHRGDVFRELARNFSSK